MKTYKYYEVFMIEPDTSVHVIDSYNGKVRALSKARTIEKRVNIPVFVNEVVHSSERVLSEKLIYPLEV